VAEWKEKTFEVCTNPDEGDMVQFAAVHILRLSQWHKNYGIPWDEINEWVHFYAREKE
jgi:hypothetical protein